MVDKITGAITPLEEVAKINEIIDNLGGKNIGELVWSLIPQTQSGLHLLDGSLISGSGSYGAFVTYIAGLMSDYSNLFETEANWQTSVSTYGVCGKFVYDSVNNTVRLPKITGFVEGTIDASALGDLVQAGLPDHFHIDGFAGVNATASYGVMTTTTQGNINTQSGTSTSNHAKTSNASLSNSIYGNSTTVQPQSIKGYIYIVIANTNKTAIQVDIDEIATDLNGKADVDLTNVNQSGKNKAMSWCAPDYANKESKNVNTTYTASSDGYLIVRVDGASVGSMIYINNELVSTSGIYTSWYCVTNAVVSKGNTYSFGQSGGAFQYAYFVPMKGAN